MPLLGLAYVLACRSPNPWILAGLGCGAAGDVFLIRAERSGLFLAGLAAFLLGHLSYLVAFVDPVLRSGPDWPWVFAAAFPLAAYGVLIYRRLRPNLGSMKLPVALYTAVILGMALAALLRMSLTTGLPASGDVRLTIEAVVCPAHGNRYRYWKRVHLKPRANNV